MKYEGDERRSDYGWHLDKRLNVGHIISTVLLAVAAFTYINKFDQRLSILEATTQARAEYQEQTNRALNNELRGINQKLDRLIERLAER